VNPVTEMGAPNGGGPVQLREVYQLVNATRAEILAELRTMDVRWESRMSSHEADHAKDTAHRSGLTRWAVTSILSGIGVLVSLYFSLRGR
jgi:hypothetical protein